MDKEPNTREIIVAVDASALVAFNSKLVRVVSLPFAFMLRRLTTSSTPATDIRSNLT